MFVITAAVESVGSSPTYPLMLRKNVLMKLSLAIIMASLASAALPPGYGLGDVQAMSTHRIIEIEQELCMFIEYHGYRCPQKYCWSQFPRMIKGVRACKVLCDAS